MRKTFALSAWIAHTESSPDLAMVSNFDAKALTVFALATLALLHTAGSRRAANQR